MTENRNLITAIERVQKLAEGSKLQRLLHNPLKYFNALFFRKLIYPLNKKGKLTLCKSFFDTPINVLLPAGTDIYLLGAKSHSSEIKLAKFICKNLQHNAVFIDIGAHFGYYSLLASKIVGKQGKVVGIEASKSIFEVLKENASNAENLLLFNMACTDKKEDVTFYEFPVLYSEYNTLMPDQFESSAWTNKNKAQKINVQGNTLDAFLKPLNLKPDFIKIDVEGAEDKVISGMKSTLENNHQLIIAMEYLKETRHNTAHIQATKLLLEAGFIPHIILNDAKTKPVAANEIQSYLESKDMESDNIILKKPTQ
ncbi:MAG: FkbM family methyltransferase [Chitinophagales bacterium]